MPEEKEIFYLDQVLPEASKVFSFDFKALEDISENCIYVLDTNVLFVPFDSSGENLVDIKSILLDLKKDNRLYLPARVAREFANNRATKIGDLFLKIRQSKNNLNTGNFKTANYPLLEENKNYQKLIKKYKEIKKLISESRKLLEEVEGDVLNWNWNDNVSKAYKEIFTPELIVEVKKAKAELIEDLEFRIDHKIAPGYKDSGKIDDGIGDLVIWQTILEIAKQHKSDLVFVTNDQKNDWFYKQDKEGLYAKYELFDEFRRFTKGKSIQIISFPNFLELNHARKETVEEIRQTIKKSDSYFYPKNHSIKDLRKGLLIEHESYGVGTITGFFVSSDDKDGCIINFRNGPRKAFLTKHTPMKILDNDRNRRLLNKSNENEILDINEALYSMDQSKMDF